MGSSPTLKIMGMVAVAAFAACAETLPPVAAITATCRRTKTADRDLLAPLLLSMTNPDVVPVRQPMLKLFQILPPKENRHV